LKGHVAIDPDSELVTATAVSAGNVGDAGTAADLLAADRPADDEQPGDPASEPAAGADGGGGPLTVYGDAAYGTGELLTDLENAGADSYARCSRRPRPAAGSPKTRSPST
jgi:hypothetical protein